MYKFSWDINISDIPFGWDSAYNEAISNSPEGRFESLTTSCYNEIKSEKVWYHPVKFKETIINMFSLTSKLAKEIYDNADLKNNDSISLLIKYDAILIELISLWNDDCTQMDAFDPNDLTIEKLYQPSIQNYFSQDIVEYLSSLGIKKFINISL